jgi:hypothetical protein
MGGSAGARPVPARQLWLLLLGFCVWCSALIVVYALQAIGCGFGWSTYTLRFSLILAVLVHLAIIGGLWRIYANAAPDPALGQTGSFLRWVIVWTLIAAFVTTVFTLGPPLLLTTCA